MDWGFINQLKSKSKYRLEIKKLYFIVEIEYIKKQKVVNNMFELTKYDIERTLNRKKIRNQVPKKTKNEKVREIIKKNYQKFAMILVTEGAKLTTK